MNVRKSLVCLLLAAPMLAAPLAARAAPAAPDDPLYVTVQGLDATVFDAYNRCDVKVLGDLVTDDLEFYHDRTGLAVGRAPFIDSMQKYICGKVHRDLIAGTLEIYPLQGYGAVEIGSHRFCDARKYSKCVEAKSGDAKFVMLWRQDKDGWKLTRVISYDHLDRPTGE
jgi:hypothetical protein